MAIDFTNDEPLRRARNQLRDVNLDLKLGTLDGELVVIAVERKSAEPLEDVPPLRYPSADLAEWVGEVVTRVGRK